MSEYTQTKFESKSFNPVAFGRYVDRIPTTKKTELVKSRVLKNNAEIAQAFSSQTGTAYATIPMYGRIGGEALNYDGKTDITASSTTTFERGVVVVGRSNSWMEGDFAQDITGGVDFMDNVGQQIAEYWDDIDQNILLAIIEGVFAMTGVKNLEFVDKHTFDITAKSGEDKDGNPLNCVNAATLNTALQKALGDNKSKITMALLHSQIATNLENIKVLSYLKQTDANGIERPLALAAWNGRIVLIDDGMPTEEVEAAEGTPAYTKYTSYVFGDGAFDYENIGAKVPYEMLRDPKTNGGQDILYSRQRKVFAPYGISYTRKVQSTLSPTNAELKNGTNWELVHDGETASKRQFIDHKAIPIARIISCG